MATKKKFEVRVFEVHSYTVEVEADDQYDAKAKVNDMLCKDTLPEKPVVEFSHTMDTEHWDVGEVK